MKNDIGRTASIWVMTEEVPPQPLLVGDTHADVCIVGAGISGMTTAYLLGREGKSVVVLNDGFIGSGQTERTTAHLSNEIDDTYSEIERLHGREAAHLVAQSHTAAIDRIEAIVSEERIDCGFERIDGYLFVPSGDSTDVLDRELEAVQNAGLVDVELIQRTPIDSFDTGPCLRFPRQGQFHPLKYLSGLARAIRRDGGRIFIGARVEKIKGGSGAYVKTSRGNIVNADTIVVATNTPINDLFTIYTKQVRYMTYAIGACVPRGSITKALYWDTSDPYHYIRLQGIRSVRMADEKNNKSSGHDILIVGGEDHRIGQRSDADERYKRLGRWTLERFPMIERIGFRWSGQVIETIDGLAFIGHNPGDESNVYIATGGSGMGITYGTIAGILLTDLILGRENPWATLYDPSRKTPRTTRRFAGEDLSTQVE